MSTPSLPLPAGGCTISFSAGTSGPEATRYRIVSNSGAARLLALLARFPELGSFFSSPPIVLNAYPATFTPPPNVVFLDSYGRWQTFASGLALAARHELPAAIISTPLAAAHLLLAVIDRQTPLPRNILLFLGGYYCPGSLERFLVNLLGTAGAKATVVHLYGVAEIDAGLLAAKRDTPDSDLVYYSIDPDWQPRIEDGLLRFRRVSGACAELPTDDPATADGDGFRLGVPSPRLAGDIHALLESFTFEDWRRRTGFLGRSRSGIAIQCRPTIAPNHDHSEVEYYDFSRSCSHCWLDKPGWA
jgi:hypothetical protein